MEQVLWSALFIPLAGFLFILALSEKLPRRAIEVIGPGTIFASFLCFCYLLYHSQNAPAVSDSTLFTWIPIKGLYTEFSLHLDHLSLLMTLIITGVGFLIHAYSVGYMDHDSDIARYFSVMNFFIFSMLLLVLASNLMVFFIGWEGVGLASYLLIGFWYQRPAAAKAAKKAFVVNRIGDLGLLLGILLTFFLFGTSDIQQVCALAGSEYVIGAPIIAVLTLLYFWGATGKSAQIPLHVWLPDAMEGPTPVSALIHAATMVTAGVYLMVRMHPLLLAAPTTMQVVAIIGGLTSLFAAMTATSQTDVKRVLAYSTVSQLGLMFFACGVGAFFAAMFHLTTHAFVKALLFLSAGNVIHMMHGTTEMDKMGGIAQIMPKTNALFLIGVLSMAGIPPLAIFFSKDLILEDLASCRLCYITGLLISLLTAFYLTRAYFLTFRGPNNVPPKILKELHEAPSVMWLPVAILGILSIVGGLLGFSLNKPPILMRFLEQDSLDFASKELTFGWHLTLETWVSIAVALTGFGIAAILYSRYRQRLGEKIRLFYNSFYINELYAAMLVRPMRALSKCITSLFEPLLYDSSIQVTADTSLKTAEALQEVQSGQIRSYISWIAAGAAFVILYLVYEGFQ